MQATASKLIAWFIQLYPGYKTYVLSGLTALASLLQFAAMFKPEIKPIADGVAMILGSLGVASFRAALPLTTQAPAVMGKVAVAVDKAGDFIVNPRPGEPAI